VGGKFLRVKDRQQPGRILRKLTLFALAVILQAGFTSIGATSYKKTVL
jgi:hypothetical protein